MKKKVLTRTRGTGVGSGGVSWRQVLGGRLGMDRQKAPGLMRHAVPNMSLTSAGKAASQDGDRHVGWDDPEQGLSAG